MAKGKLRTEIARDTLGVGLANRIVPGRVLRAYLAKSQSALMKELGSRSRLQNRAAKAKRISRPMTRTPKERQQLRKQIADFSRHFAKHALPVRPTGIELPGIFSVTAKLAPTFGFARTESDLSGIGNTLTATRSTGAMGLTFSNQAKDGILRFSIVEMGGFFFPPSGAVRIAARATPRVAFSWFLNSEGRRVFTDGFVSVHIVGFKGASHHGEARGAVQLWRENRDEGTNGFEFDVSPAAEFPLSTQLKTNNSDFYLIMVRCFAAHGASTPGKQDLDAHVLGSISASLASIDVDISVIPQIVEA